MASRKPTGQALAEKVRERTGHAFVDIERLERALTHSSARRHAGSDYERLEFLGDRVLGLVVAEMLFKAFPRAPEGELAVRLNALVSGATCADVAEEIGLSDLIRADSGLKTLSGTAGRSTRADAMEALLAAIYLDGGLEAARPLIERHWGPRSRQAQGAQRDPKTEMQEWAHQSVAAAPVYVIAGREGPDHEPVFTVTVTVGALEPTIGRGRSKREAEQAGAAAMLQREGVWPKPEDPR
jgi:ribonuclease-3